jgi:ferrous iron transport protein B
VAIGLNGVILLAYIIAIPANEIVVPTILMLYLGTTMMTEELTPQGFRELLVEEQGWTLLTAVNLMLFSLLHNPCATTIYTMWKETKRVRWTLLGALGPLAIAFAVTFTVAQVVQLLT